MLINKFFRRHRRKILGIAFVMLAPGLLIAGLFVMSSTDTVSRDLKVAAIAINDHYLDNPPYGVWRYDGVRITGENRLIVDVHVAVIPHATFIRTRNNRIRYSYLKLACPKAGANVHRYLVGTPIWINLKFHDETLLLGACPKSLKGGLYTS